MRAGPTGGEFLGVPALPSDNSRPDVPVLRGGVPWAPVLPPSLS